MEKLKKGDVVTVNRIVGQGVPLPAVGVVDYETNSPDSPEWYAVKIKWVEYVNHQCGCSIPTCFTVDRERLCDVRRDWMEIKDNNPKNNCLSLAKAFDLYCRHNDANLNKICDLRKQGHWFRVISVKDEHDKSPTKTGDVILVSSGYVTNVTQGWSYDTLINRTHGSTGSDWEHWETHQCAWGAKIFVERISSPSLQTIESDQSEPKRVKITEIVVNKVGTPYATCDDGQQMNVLEVWKSATVKVGDELVQNAKGYWVHQALL